MHTSEGLGGTGLHNQDTILSGVSSLNPRVQGHTTRQSQHQNQDLSEGTDISENSAGSDFMSCPWKDMGLPKEKEFNTGPSACLPRCQSSLKTPQGTSESYYFNKLLLQLRVGDPEVNATVM